MPVPRNGTAEMEDPMKALKMTLLAITTISLVLFLVGCGDNAPNDALNSDPTDEEIDLNAEFGGYDTNDESPAFGDDDMMKNEDDGVDAQDAMDEDPEVISIGAAVTTDVYVVRLAWGLLEGDSSNTAVTDWSGSISVDQGAVVVERLLRFEKDDHIVRPRVDRTVIDLVSTTIPHWDGLLITVLDPIDDTLDAVENVLHISLGDFEISYTTLQLVELEEIHDVDLLGNQFSVNAFLVDEFPCGRGFLAGEWRHTNEFGGDFRGRWTTYTGLGRGNLKGRWGVNEEGVKVFFGKYINLNGEFRGLLRGHWGHGESRGCGWLRGAWHGNEEIKGLLRGVWKHEWHGPVEESANSVAERKGGFFHGRWFEACDPAALVDEFAPGQDL